MKTPNLSQVSFPLLFPLCYIIPLVFTNSVKGKKNRNYNAVQRRYFPVMLPLSQAIFSGIAFAMILPPASPKVRYLSPRSCKICSLEPIFFISSQAYNTCCTSMSISSGREYNSPDFVFLLICPASPLYLLP